MNSQNIYNRFQKSIGNSKFFYSLGWFIFIIGIFCFISFFSSFISWNFRKNNYNKEYVYSDFGTLYYELNGEKIYIENVYNSYDDKITMNVPDKETVIMYINKDNINEGIYFDSNESVDINSFNFVMSIIVIFSLLIIGLYYILTNKEVKKDKVTLRPVFLIFLLLFLIGCVILFFELYKVINYYTIKSQNNITTATIYSQIYDENNNENNNQNNTYKYIAYYYVNGEKYIYVNDIYESGNFNDRLGETFELYYKETNPNKVTKQENPINFRIFNIALIFIAFSLPFLIYIKKMERILQNNMLEQDNNELK